MSATITGNKYRAAVEVLQRGRDRLVEALADEVLDQEEGFQDSEFLFNEFLEMQGTRLHFLSLLLQQLEQSAETLDQKPSTAPAAESPVVKPPRKRKSRERKLASGASSDGAREES